MCVIVGEDCSRFDWTKLSVPERHDSTKRGVSVSALVVVVVVWWWLWSLGERERENVTHTNKNNAMMTPLISPSRQHECVLAWLERRESKGHPYDRQRKR